MTREDLKEKVREDLGLTKQEASEVVERVIDTIRDALSNGEEIILSGFGKFSVRTKKQRIGRNPKTGKEYEISSRRVVSFKASKNFKEDLNPK